MSYDVKMFSACDHKVVMTQKAVLNKPILDIKIDSVRNNYTYFFDNDNYPLNMIDIKNDSMVYAKTADNSFFYTIDKQRMNRYAYIRQQYATKYKVYDDSMDLNKVETKISHIFADITSINGVEFKLNDKNLRSNTIIKVETKQKKPADVNKSPYDNYLFTDCIINLKVIDDKYIYDDKSYILEIIKSGTEIENALYKVYEENTKLEDIIKSKEILNSSIPNTTSINGVSFIVKDTSLLNVGDKIRITTTKMRPARVEVVQYLNINGSIQHYSGKLEDFLFTKLLINNDKHIVNNTWFITIIEANLSNIYTYNKMVIDNEYDLICEVQDIEKVLKQLKYTDVDYNNENIVYELHEKKDLYGNPIYKKEIYEKSILTDYSGNSNQCPRCYGSGVYFDIAFDNDGKAILIDDSLKLQQEVFKIVMQEKGENLFHKQYGIELNKRIAGSKNFDNIKPKLEFIVSQAINHLFDLQQNQKISKRNTTPGEVLKSVESINVTRTSPTTYSVNVSIKAEDETNLTSTVYYDI